MFLPVPTDSASILSCATAAGRLMVRGTSPGRRPEIPPTYLQGRGFDEAKGDPIAERRVDMSERFFSMEETPGLR